MNVVLSNSMDNAASLKGHIIDDNLLNHPIVLLQRQICSSLIPVLMLDILFAVLLSPLEIIAQVGTFGSLYLFVLFSRFNYLS